MKNPTLVDSRGDPNKNDTAKKRQSHQTSEFLLFVASSSLPAPAKFLDAHYDLYYLENFQEVS
ncbi:MAG: hypothetical protein HY584_01895 [Candidatus Omnitrophica bacterium]|nr:hypothetical protein [Candidatus Omnitrophota bacterium]